MHTNDYIMSWDNLKISKFYIASAHTRYFLFALENKLLKRLGFGRKANLIEDKTHIIVYWEIIAISSYIIYKIFKSLNICYTIFVYFPITFYRHYVCMHGFNHMSNTQARKRIIQMQMKLNMMKIGRVNVLIDWIDDDNVIPCRACWIPFWASIWTVGLFQCDLFACILFVLLLLRWPEHNSLQCIDLYPHFSQSKPLLEATHPARISLEMPEHTENREWSCGLTREWRTGVMRMPVDKKARPPHRTYSPMDFI